MNGVNSHSLNLRISDLVSGEPTQYGAYYGDRERTYTSKQFAAFSLVGEMRIIDNACLPSVNLGNGCDEIQRLFVSPEELVWCLPL